MLTRFVLSNNSLKGPVPSQLGKLTAMQETVGLESNSLTGQLPSELGQLTRLLTELDLYHNQLRSTIPSELGRLACLRSGFLATRAGFYGPIPSELGQWNSCSVPPWVTHVAQTQRPSYAVDLSENSLSGTIPTELGGLSLLHYKLALSSNFLSGPIPSQLGQLTALGALELHSNKLTGPIPAQLGQCTRLQVFAAFNNGLAGPVPESFCDLPLVHLLLSRTKITGLPSACAMLALQTLDLSQAHLRTMPSLRLMRNLSAVLLHKNSIDGTLQDLEVPPDSCIEYLTLHRNSITSEMPRKWPLSPCAKVFTLGHNAVGGTLPKDFLSRVGQRDPLILVDHNRLSGPTAQNTVDFGQLGPTSLIAPGNALQAHPAEWIPRSQRQVSFAFVEPTASLVTVCVLVGAAVLSIMAFLAFRRWQLSLSLHERDGEKRAQPATRDWVDQGHEPHRRVQEMPAAEQSKLMSSLACAFVAVGVVLSAVLLSLNTLSNDFYADPDVIVQYLSLAYLFNPDPTLAMAIIVCAALGLTVLAIWLFWVTIAAPQAHLTGTGCAPSVCASPSSSTWLSQAAAVLLAIGLCVLAGVPIVVYVLSHNLLPLVLSNSHTGALKVVLAVWCALLSTAFIPMAGRCAARMFHGLRAWRWNELERLDDDLRLRLHRFKTYFEVFARFLVLVVMPVLVVFVVDDACLGYWTAFWGPCQSGGAAFEITLSYAAATTVMADARLKETIAISVLTPDDVCGGDPSWSKCGRSVAGVLAPLYLYKVHDCPSLLLAAAQSAQRMGAPLAHLCPPYRSC